MKRYLAFAIIGAVLIATVISGLVLSSRQVPPPAQPSAAGAPGAEPPHVRGSVAAPLVLEEFGDFECMPCFVLWPALQNLKREFGDRLAVVFRQRPLPQHQRAPDAARAAEAAGLQGRFWEMHDLLYMHRSTWLRSSDVGATFRDFASQLQIDVERFGRDINGEDVRRRLAADDGRGTSLGVDRTPVLFLNGRRLRLQADVEAALRADFEQELQAKGR